jgi:hypothetical protein
MTTFNNSFEYMIITMETQCPQDFYNLDWAAISCFRYLSEPFMEKYYFRLKWASLCTHQKLSETFIRKFSNFVNYKVISNSQINNLSIDYIYENRLKLDMNVIKTNKRFLEKTDNISLFYNLFKDQIEEFKMCTKIVDDQVLTVMKSCLQLQSHLRSIIDVSKITDIAQLSKMHRFSTAHLNIV